MWLLQGLITGARGFSSIVESRGSITRDRGGNCDAVAGYISSVVLPGVIWT